MITHRGRAAAVKLVAATKGPTRVRISFRARERKDVDLILGRGMLALGWHAHTANAPGKFLAATEHDAPKRARAYLATDY